MQNTKEISVSLGQTIEDVAIQEYGDMSGVVWILEDNQLSMDDLLFAGQKLRIRKDRSALGSDAAARFRYLSERKIKPNTGLAGSEPDGYVEEDYVEEDYVE